MTSQHLTGKPNDPSDQFPLAQKLAYLTQATSYENEGGSIEAIETHMSWIFLTGRHAYKLKKPVFYEPIDFRTVEARRFYCEEEFRLNRRLAPDVYIGTIPLTADESGRLQLAGRGQVVDWLVKMHRLPADAMLDHKLMSGTAGDDEADRIMVLLAKFYHSSSPAGMTAKEYIESIEAELLHSCEVLCAPAYALSTERIHAIHDAQKSALRMLNSELLHRVSSGRIIEAHGDLRPEHVCLRENVAIIDSLEFSKALRTMDMADEVAFLALECERLEAQDFAKSLLDAYRVHLHDDVPARLIHFYQSRRALTRAKLAIRHLDEEQFRRSEKWIARTERYLSLADEHAGRTLA